MVVGTIPSKRLLPKRIIYSVIGCRLSIGTALAIILYEENKSELLQEELPISQQVYSQNTVATTWKISFDQDPLASEMLRVIIFLDGSKIQKGLVYCWKRSAD
jgi:hypothetical protein